jgi:hypothetical protein
MAWSSDVANMKRTPLIVAAATAFLLNTAPSRATGASFIDGFYTADARVQSDGVDFDDGDGYGLKARAMLGENLFFTAEYTNNEYDPFRLTFQDGPLGALRRERFEVEVEMFRAGLGMHLPNSPAYLRGEYIGYEAEISTTGSEDDEEVVGEADREDGFGVHVGALGRFSERFWLNAEAGYVDINDVGSGAQFLGEIGLDIVQGFGAFAGYRYFQLRDDGDRLEFGEARVGLRLSFL